MLLNLKWRQRSQPYQLRNQYDLLEKPVYFQDGDLHAQNHEQISSEQRYPLKILQPVRSSDQQHKILNTSKFVYKNNPIN